MYLQLLNQTLIIEKSFDAYKLTIIVLSLNTKQYLVEDVYIYNR